MPNYTRQHVSEDPRRSKSSDSEGLRRSVHAPFARHGPTRREYMQSSQTLPMSRPSLLRLEPITCRLVKQGTGIVFFFRQKTMRIKFKPLAKSNHSFFQLVAIHLLHFSIIRGPSSETAWSPIVSVTFFYSLKFCKSHTAAYTVSRKLLTFSEMVTNNPRYP